MARTLRYLPEPFTVFEITARCIQERFLLRPSPEANQLILGVLGRALSLFPEVQLYAFKFLSNHFHLLMGCPSLQIQVSFMNHVMGNIAREVGRLHEWRDKFWSRRYVAIPILDQDKLDERLHYLFSHGCKENLVAAPRDWPGTSSEPAMAQGTPLEGIWYDRTGYYHALRKKRPCTLMQFAVRYPVLLAPLPHLKHLKADQAQRIVSELLERIERDTWQRHLDGGTEPLGIEAVLAQNPRERPRQSKHSPAPLCHTSKRRDRRAFREAYRCFARLYKEASRAFRMGERQAEFPQGCFLPPAGFCPGLA